MSQVYLASSAPPVRYPNVYGVDMPNRKEFVAHGLTEDQVGGGVCVAVAVMHCHSCVALCANREDVEYCRRSCN